MCSVQVASQEILIEQPVVDGNAGEGPKQQIDLLVYENSTTMIHMEGFSIGNATYSFIQHTSCDCFLRRNKWICIMKQLSEYQGEGDTPDEALRSFQETIHIEFQRLYAKRSFEMTEDENRRWLRLANTIDLLEYKTKTPLTYRKIGCISHGKVSWPVRIKWIDGDNFSIDPSYVPGTLMACKPGQWIDAVVAEDPVSHKIIKIDSFDRISFYIPTDNQIQKYWDSLPKTSLPQTTWD